MRARRRLPPDWAQSLRIVSCNFRITLIDVTRTCSNDNIQLIRANLDLMPLARLPYWLRIVAETVLPTQFLGDLRKRIRQIFVCVVHTGSSLVGQGMQILIGESVLFRTRPRHSNSGPATSAGPA